MWHEQTKKARASGELVILGLIQEQHADRCALWMQWKGFDWPVLVDSLNRTGVHAVPLYWLIDEHGILRKKLRRPRAIADFLGQTYPEPAKLAEREKLDPADGAFLVGKHDDAIDAYTGKVKAKPADGESWFRLGCSYRARHDSKGRRPGDFQSAVDAWSRATSLRPGNYIFRRRIQQYGPRLQKPYPFYDWVPEARKAIVARGDKPLPLVAEPQGSELAARIRRFEPAANGGEQPDKDGKLPRDKDGLVAVAGVVAPRPFGAGHSARVYLRFTPNKRKKVTWDNGAGPLTVWIETPAGWQQSARLLTAPMVTEKASSKEVRSVELEVATPASAKVGKHELSGYAVYWVCDGTTGVCAQLRHDFRVPVELVNMGKGGKMHRRGRRRR